jgi:hypothetical protein
LATSRLAGSLIKHAEGVKDEVMDEELIRGLVVVMAIGAVILLVFRMFADASYRFRGRLFERGEMLLNNDNVCDADKIVVEEMLRLSEIPAGGWLVVRAYARAAFGHRQESIHRANKAELDRITLDFVIATLGANPVALVIVIPIVLALAIRTHMAVKRAARAGATTHVPHTICNA